VPSWIGQSLARGIVTSRYPKVAATEEEVPDTGRPPVPGPEAGGAPTAASRCPVDAIAEDRVDQGRCIRCARCIEGGLRFSGAVEAATRSREALVVPSPAARTDATAPPPLVGFRRSLHVFLVDVGSCNACNLEVLGLANPLYDLQRLGIFFTNSPRHADVLLVVGVPTRAMVVPLRRAFESLPEPKAVVAVGACPISGGVFAGTPELFPSLAEIVPVDVFVPGCPPAPVAILDGLLRVTGRARAPPRGAP
jgi:Ni,Fe-hydrogenase III small subunit